MPEASLDGRCSVPFDSVLYGMPSVPQRPHASDRKQAKPSDEFVQNPASSRDLAFGRAPLSLSCLVMLSMTACAPTVRQDFAANALPRAAFELQCPKEKIELVELTPPLDSGIQAGAQVGVTGCGKRLVYVLSVGAGWVANSHSDEKPSP